MLIVLLFAMISQGAFFPMAAIILNLYFLAKIIFTKKPLRINKTACLLLAIPLLMSTWGLFATKSSYGALLEIIKYTLYPASYLVFINTEEKPKIQNYFLLTIVMLAVFGLLGLTGFAPLANMINTNGNRVQSLLQYANTTALFFAIGVFYCTDKYMENKQLHWLILAVALFISLLLTKSRTAFAIFGVIYGLYLLRLIPRKWYLALLVGASLLCAILLLVGSRLMNISLFEPTLVERLISFSDALRLLLKHPLGIGVDSWQFLQFSAQSAPYQVNRIHNYYLQLWLDGGPLVLLIWLYILWTHLAKKPMGLYSYIGLFICLYSAWDVHMNYGIVIVFFTFALANLNTLQTFKTAKFYKYFALLPAVVFLLLFISQYNMNRGKVFPSKAQASYSTAIKLFPNNHEAYYYLAKSENNPQTALELLEKGYSKNPLYLPTITALIQGYKTTGQHALSYKYALIQFEIRPYSKEVQNQLLESIKELENDQTQELEAQTLRLIEEKNQALNPLYRYIKQDMSYF